MTDWAKKTWFVTGASTGFGRAFIEAALNGGGRVIATARNTDALAYLAGAGDRALALRLDVTRQDEIDAAMAAAVAFGGFDVLVNNAGYGFLGGVEEAGVEEIEAQFAVNFFGALHVTRGALPLLRERGEGFILNISSIAGLRSFPGAAFYSATKFALEGLSEGLRHEVAKFGIKVMIIEPGYFRTDFQGRSIGLTVNSHPAYPELVEARSKVRSGDGKQQGDPKRGVAAIIAAMGAHEPPVRLPLGPDGAQIARDATQARLTEIDAWQAVSADTLFRE